MDSLSLKKFLASYIAWTMEHGAGIVGNLVSLEYREYPLILVMIIVSWVCTQGTCHLI